MRPSGCLVEQAPSERRIVLPGWRSRRCAANEHTPVHKRRSEAHPTGASACYASGVAERPASPGEDREGAAGMIKLWRDWLVALLFRSGLWTALIIGAVLWSAR